jgi:hypothetical protein|nr:hypothetical protein [Odoribacter splanchnicus]
MDKQISNIMEHLKINLDKNIKTISPIILTIPDNNIKNANWNDVQITMKEPIEFVLIDENGNTITLETDNLILQVKCAKLY